MPHVPRIKFNFFTLFIFWWSQSTANEFRFLDVLPTSNKLFISPYMPFCNFLICKFFIFHPLQTSQPDRLSHNAFRCTSLIALIAYLLYKFDTDFDFSQITILIHLDFRQSPVHN